MKLTKEQMQEISKAAEYFVSHCDPEKDERTSRIVAFQSGFVSALKSVGFDISAVGEPKEFCFSRNKNELD